MVIIIASGFAVGDPMVYENVGLLLGLIVVIVAFLLYRFITVVAAKFKPLERYIAKQPKLINQNVDFV